MAIYSWARLMYFFWHGVVVMLLVKGLCFVFLWWLIFGLNPKWACFSSTLLWNVKLFWDGVPLSFLHQPLSCPSVCFFTLDWAQKTRIFLFFSTAVTSAWRPSHPLMQLGPNDWTVLLEISPHTLLISSVKFCSHGSRVGEKGLA